MALEAGPRPGLAEGDGGRADEARLRQHAVRRQAHVLGRFRPDHRLLTGEGGMADKFFWYELMTSDQDAAADYYCKVVGWTASDAPMPGGGDRRYLILNVGERGVGGVRS